MFNRRGWAALGVLVLGGALAAYGAGEPAASAGFSGSALDTCLAEATELKKA